MDHTIQAASTEVKVVEQCRVSPPPAAVPPTVVPLTFFDVVWLFMGPIKRLFFYQCNTITSDAFLSTHLPALRHSLSLTLRPFFSLAGHLLQEDLVIEYAEGDSVSLLVAESDDDFSAVMADDVKDVRLSRPLVPLLPSADDRGRRPVLALQFTVFPCAGFSLGMAFHHAAADGNSIHRFVKSWAANHRSGGDPSALPKAPVYERGALLELEEEKMGFLKDVKELVTATQADLRDSGNAGTLAGQTVRVTFVLTREQIEKLRDRIMPVTGTRPSSFVAVCSYVWVCLTKARGHVDKTVYLRFPADCRTRVDPPVLDAYFGNLIGIVICEASGALLGGTDGLVTASKVILARIHALDGQVVKGLRELTNEVVAPMNERTLIIAGSPRLGVYKTDFGWGPPRKVEVVSIEDIGAVSLDDSRKGDGGIEIGMVGPAPVLENFKCFFKAGLESL